MPMPTKYKPKYPQMLIEHMKKGNSFESFGAIVHASGETLETWSKKHEAFGLAKQIGKMYELQYWEELLKNGAAGTLPAIQKRIAFMDKHGNLRRQTIFQEPGKFNATAVIFALKNKFPKQYREKIEVEHSGENPENLTPEEIKRRKELYASIVKKNGT